MMLKAFSTFPAPDQFAEGCCLVYAKNHGQAKAEGLQAIPWYGAGEFVDMRVRRIPEYDQYADPKATKPYAVVTNEDLPEGAPDFYLDDEDY